MEQILELLDPEPVAWENPEAAQDAIVLGLYAVLLAKLADQDIGSVAAYLRSRLIVGEREALLEPARRLALDVSRLYRGETHQPGCP